MEIIVSHELLRRKIEVQDKEMDINRILRSIQKAAKSLARVNEMEEIVIVINMGVQRQIQTRNMKSSKCSYDAYKPYDRDLLLLFTAKIYHRRKKEKVDEKLLFVEGDNDVKEMMDYSAKNGLKVMHLSVFLKHDIKFFNITVNDDEDDENAELEEKREILKEEEIKEIDLGNSVITIPASPPAINLSTSLVSEVAESQEEEEKNEIQENNIKMDDILKDDYNHKLENKEALIDDVEKQILTISNFDVSYVRSAIEKQKSEETNSNGFDYKLINLDHNINDDISEKSICASSTSASATAIANAEPKETTQKSLLNLNFCHDFSHYISHLEISTCDLCRMEQTNMYVCYKHDSFICNYCFADLFKKEVSTWLPSCIIPDEIITVKVGDVFEIGINIKNDGKIPLPETCTIFDAVEDNDIQLWEQNITLGRVLQPHESAILRIPASAPNKSGEYYKTFLFFYENSLIREFRITINATN